MQGFWSHLFRFRLQKTTYFISENRPNLTQKLDIDRQICIYVNCLARILSQNLKFGSTESVFIAFERTEFLAILSFVGGILRLTFCLAALWWSADILIVIAAATVATSLVMFLSLGLVLRYSVHLKVPVDYQFCQQQLKIAFPFIFIGIFFIMDNRLDVLVLSLLADEGAVGIYSAAVSIITALTIMPQGIRNAILPIFSQQQAKFGKVSLDTYERMIKYMLILTIPIAVGLTLTSSEVVSFIYSDRFVLSVPVLQILVWSFVFYSLNIINSRLLFVRNQQGRIARFLGVSLGINIALNLLLVPVMGLVGAGVARLSSTGILYLQTQWAAQQRAGALTVLRLLFRPLLAAFGIVLCLIWFGHHSLWMQIPLAAAVYLLILYLSGAFPTDEQLLWRRTILNLTYR
ncbi:polysaccharide biosynthesis C-terminal domain-containing protein [Chloroflexi bacterium TSY]|nr:polysaccharide biosynthesis C-terminal domain-containing protein [Chloroflexi bacterium TSY]MBV7329277.1 polysaccharide biosynthesis C-terminal domain-containing protein [Chloroflexi bacterium TSY]